MSHEHRAKYMKPSRIYYVNSDDNDESIEMTDVVEVNKISPIATS